MNKYHANLLPECLGVVFIDPRQTAVLPHPEEISPEGPLLEDLLQRAGGRFPHVAAARREGEDLFDPLLAKDLPGPQDLLQVGRGGFAVQARQGVGEGEGVFECHGRALAAVGRHGVRGIANDNRSARGAGPRLELGHSVVWPQGERVLVDVLARSVHHLGPLFMFVMRPHVAL